MQYHIHYIWWITVTYYPKWVLNFLINEHAYRQVFPSLVSPHINLIRIGLQNLANFTSQNLDNHHYPQINNEATPNQFIIQFRWFIISRNSNANHNESNNLVELNKNLNSEFGAEYAIRNHVIQSLRQAHPDRRSPVQLEGRHSSLTITLPYTKCEIRGNQISIIANLKKKIRIEVANIQSIQKIEVGTVPIDDSSGSIIRRRSSASASMESEKVEREREGGDLGLFIPYIL